MPKQASHGAGNHGDFRYLPYWGKCRGFEKTLDGINKKIQNEIRINACLTQNQDEYEQRYNTLCAYYEKNKTEYDKTLQTIEDKKARKLKTNKFFAELKCINAPVSEFGEKIFEKLVEKIIVKGDEIQVEWKGWSKLFTEQINFIKNHLSSFFFKIK